jgi:serine O-acetyltransferase
MLEAQYPPTSGPFALFDRVLDRALERTQACFERIILRGYRRDGIPYFNHLHGDHSAVLYYFAANSAWQLGDMELAARFFLLNKMQNALVCMYDTALPDVFLLIHTVGTVLGKATYGNFFVAYQNVTIGTEDGRSPILGEHSVVYGGSMVLGSTDLGRGSVVSAQSTLIDASIPPNSVVAGRSPELLVKPRKRDFAQQYWDVKP